MARIFDNIEPGLLGTLRATLSVSTRADFCVGYLKLRGWQAVDDLVQPWSADAGQVCIKLFLPYPLHAKLYPQRSKPIVDEIDAALAQAWGLSPEAATSW